MFKSIINSISEAKRIVIIQGENPDGDSLASSIALEYILDNLGKEVFMYCAINIPRYLSYIKGWDRVVNDWPKNPDMAIIVDTSASALLEKTLAEPVIANSLSQIAVSIIDHHQTDSSDLPFKATFINEPNAVATGEVIYNMIQQAGWEITPEIAESLFISIQSDSLGLTTQGTTATSYQIAAQLVGAGANPAAIESRRRENMKKPADILEYKGRLIQRIEYLLDGKLALVHIPWSEIEEYSDRYNPSVLVLEEMKMVESVLVAVAIKTYPDGKLTGKIRSNLPIADEVAGYFGGGGHQYAAGFKMFEDYDKIVPELLNATDKAILNHGSDVL